MFRVSKSGFLVYDPFCKKAKDTLNKKYDCADCSFCQMCAESRCNLCRSGMRGKKLGLREQIEFYRQLNEQQKEKAEL